MKFQVNLIENTHLPQVLVIQMETNSGISGTGEMKIIVNGLVHMVQVKSVKRHILGNLKVISQYG